MAVNFQKCFNDLLNIIILTNHSYQECSGQFLSNSLFIMYTHSSYDSIWSDMIFVHSIQVLWSQLDFDWPMNIS